MAYPRASQCQIGFTHALCELIYESLHMGKHMQAFKFT